MTIAPPEPDEIEPDEKPIAPDLPDPAFPEVLPGGEPGSGEPETQPSPDGP